MDDGAFGAGNGAVDNSTAAWYVTDIPLDCYLTEQEGLNALPLNGWFSYVLKNKADHWCIKTYGAWMWVFAAMLGVMAILACATSLCVGFIFFRRRIKKWCGKGSQVKMETMPEVAITAIIPCYLPNEQYIIEETVNWIMDKVDSPGPLTVFVVYNTPKDLPDIEKKLLQMQARSDWPLGRKFQTMRVVESTSKAANLNAALRETKDEYAVIYDADHHPDRQSLNLLWEKMWRLGQDCVQGSYYMRNLRQNQAGCGPCAMPFLSRFIDAEFFTDWFFMKLITRTFFMGQAYFSGSNALWKTASLRDKTFDVDAQTEDVDMAIQQLLAGREIEFCAESRSGELAPMGCKACWKQRLRWTMGWDETSLKHSGSFATDGRLTCRARCGLIWTFLIRWAMTCLTLGAVWIGLPLTIIWPLSADDWGKLINLLGHVCFFSGCGPWFFSTVEAICQTQHRGRQSWIQVFFVFLVSSPFGFAAFFAFNFLQQIVSCFKICTGTVSGWEVTARGPPGPAEGIGWLDQPEASESPLQDPSSDDGEHSDDFSSDSSDQDLGRMQHGRGFVPSLSWRTRGS